jgi:hypothetical protein
VGNEKKEASQMKDTTGLGEALCEMVAKKVTEPQSLSEMEQTLRAALLWLGRIALHLWLRWVEKPYPAERIDCRCGASAKYLYRREASLRTLFGQVRYRRAYYGCEECGQGTYPLDVQLGLRPNAMSAEVERLAGMVGVEHPFGQGSRLFEALTLVSLSDQSLDKAAQAYGQEQSKREAEWEGVAYDADVLLKRQRTSKAPRRLYGALDGGRVHLREATVQEAAWRELKVGVWFITHAQAPTQPGDQWSIRAEQISYYADLCDADTFGRLVWSTGVQCHAQIAQELIILGDGARWIWDLVDEHFPQAIQIVDWFHACQYFEPIAQAAFQDLDQHKQWVEAIQSALWKGDLDRVISACQQFVNPKRQDDPAQKAVTYFTNNRSRMDYPSYRANGFHIGSGTIESGIKQISSQRLKIAGAIWNPDSARHVAKARAAYLSGQWNHLAARRTHLARAA